MRLEDVHVQRSNVYVTAEGHSYRYGIEVLAQFGFFEITEIQILSGKVYLEVKKRE